MTSQSIRTFAAHTLLIASAFSGAALADDDRNRGRDPDRGGGREFEEKYRDGNCRVERKLERNGKYKEVRECKNVQASRGNRGGYEFDEEFRDGNCIVKRKLERDGDYKEERECEGYDRRRFDQRRTVVVRQEPLYPPWVVVEQGRPVYRQGRRPDPPPAPAVSCNSETVGQILGGIAGGVLGAQVGDGSGRTVATIGGSIIGVLVGGEVGRRIDAADQACIGQALEFARDGQRVAWPGRSGARYAVQPGRVFNRNGRECRPYQTEVRTKAGVERVQGTACRQPNGVWVAPAG